MRNLDRALVDIANIRAQLAAGTTFQGFGPEVMALSGLGAMCLTAAQVIWPSQLASSQEQLLWVWVFLAIVSSVLIGIETRARAHRHHGGLADQMVLNALEQFLPSAFAGASIGAVVLVFSPDQFWLLPGLWQLLVSLGIFAAIRTLPRQIIFVAAWYFLAGIAMMILAAQTRQVEPWMMGLPFTFGQFLMATLLHFAEKGDEKEGRE